MEVIKLPKKFRMVCYEIMDGKSAMRSWMAKKKHSLLWKLSLTNTRIKWQQSRQRLPISIWTMKQH